MSVETKSTEKSGRNLCFFIIIIIIIIKSRLHCFNHCVFFCPFLFSALSLSFFLCSPVIVESFGTFYINVTKTLLFMGLVISVLYMCMHVFNGFRGRVLRFQRFHTDNS